ncbi:junction-mediating and -regulatory protein-like [Grus japonensis]|uniref:Junction-mediating and -regulatory protein-like n=1 Tax=Grus japonensis TaxID=30415 RepID=A0ABC9Y804_GRUJA
MPASSKTDPLLAKAEPINNGGSTSGIRMGPQFIIWPLSSWTQSKELKYDSKIDATVEEVWGLRKRIV